MKTKIIEILSQYIVTENGTCYCNTEIEDLATEIEALYQPQIDKLNKRVEFQVKASDTLLLQVREMESQIAKLKEITDKDIQEWVERNNTQVIKMIGLVNLHNELCNKIEQLKNELEK